MLELRNLDVIKFRQSAHFQCFFEALHIPLLLRQIVQCDLVLANLLQCDDRADSDLQEPPVIETLAEFCGFFVQFGDLCLDFDDHVASEVIGVLTGLGKF